MKVTTKKEVSTTINYIESMQKKYKTDIIKYAKLNKSKISSHKQDNKSIHIVDNNLIVIDTKFYENNIIRKDTLTLSIDNLKKRIDTIKLFDKKKLERLFSFETNCILRIDSLSKHDKLNFKNQIHSVLLRKLCIVANRFDLLIMCSMTKADNKFKEVMRNKHSVNMISEQIKTLTQEQITKSAYNVSEYKSNYSIAVKKCKAILLSTLKKNEVKKVSIKQKSSKLVKSKNTKKLVNA